MVVNRLSDKNSAKERASALSFAEYAPYTVPVMTRTLLPGVTLQTPVTGSCV